MNLRKEKNCIGFGECPNGYCLWAEGGNDPKRKEKNSGLEMKMYKPYTHINCDWVISGVKKRGGFQRQKKQHVPRGFLI